MTMELTGKHIRQMSLLADSDSEDWEEAQICRLAMLLRGEDPANDVRVSELLDLDLVDYQEYVDDVLTQMQAGAEAVRQTSGVYHLALSAGKTAVVRPLKGRQRRLLGHLDDASGDRTLMLAMSNLSESELDAMSIGDYQSLLTALSFLFQPVLDRLIRKRSPAAE